MRQRENDSSPSADQPAIDGHSQPRALMPRASVPHRTHPHIYHPASSSFIYFTLRMHLSVFPCICACSGSHGAYSEIKYGNKTNKRHDKMKFRISAASISVIVMKKKTINLINTYLKHIYFSYKCWIYFSHYF